MNIRITSFEESEHNIRFVRDQVFGEEQRIGRELDWDDKDPHCIHVVAIDDSGNAVGTGRMQPDGRIGRLAVLKQYRNRGTGGKMLEELIASARSHGLAKVNLHAQVYATRFYEKFGFNRDGSEFLEIGIKHINMTRNTQPALAHDAVNGAR